MSNFRRFLADVAVNTNNDDDDDIDGTSPPIVAHSTPLGPRGRGDGCSDISSSDVPPLTATSSSQRQLLQPKKKKRDRYKLVMAPPSPPIIPAPPVPRKSALKRTACAVQKRNVEIVRRPLPAPILKPAAPAYDDFDDEDDDDVISPSMFYEHDNGGGVRHRSTAGSSALAGSRRSERPVTWFNAGGRRAAASPPSPRPRHRIQSTVSADYQPRRRRAADRFAAASAAAAAKFGVRTSMPGMEVLRAARGVGQPMLRRRLPSPPIPRRLRGGDGDRQQRQIQRQIVDDDADHTYDRIDENQITADCHLPRLVDVSISLKYFSILEYT